METNIWFRDNATLPIGMYGHTAITYGEGVLIYGGRLIPLITDHGPYSSSSFVALPLIYYPNGTIVQGSSDLIDGDVTERSSHCVVWSEDLRTMAVWGGEAPTIGDTNTYENLR
jgi:hypothetical protein